MRIMERHRFGPHEVLLVELDEDDGTMYSVLVDGLPAEDQPLDTPPTFEQIVRLYDRSPARGPNGRLVTGTSAPAT